MGSSRKLKDAIKSKSSAMMEKKKIVLREDGEYIVFSVGERYPLLLSEGNFDVHDRHLLVLSGRLYRYELARQNAGRFWRLDRGPRR